MRGGLHPIEPDSAQKTGRPCMHSRRGHGVRTTGSWAAHECDGLDDDDDDE